MKDKFELTNKVALITGGGSGIGLGIAAAYIALGAKVAITGRNITKLEAAKLVLGDHCFIYVNDVTEKDTHEKLVETIEKEIGPIEILVNNAGIHNKKPSIEVTDAEFQMVMDTNINSVFALTRTVLKYMMPRGKGSVISISSMAALFGITQVVAYSSAKTALLGMTRSLASEYSFYRNKNVFRYYGKRSKAKRKNSFSHACTPIWKNRRCCLCCCVFSI
jgi:gluconate 5-dehydrogenase